MSERNVTVGFTANVKDGLDAIEDLEQRRDIAIQTTLRQTRLAGRAVILMARAVGVAVDTQFQVALDVVFQAIEVLTTIATAETLTGFGAFKAALLFTQIGLLIRQRTLLAQGRQKAAGQMEAAQGLIEIGMYST